MARLTGTQKKILNTGAKKGAKRSELLASMMTSLVESGGGNPNYGDRDSVGWRQERSHYGSVAERRNVRKSAGRFFDELKGTRGTKQSPGQKAQAVQRSAFPSRYDERRAEAEALVRAWQKKGGKTKAGKAGKGKKVKVPGYERRGVERVETTTPGQSFAKERQAARRELLLSGRLDLQSLLAYKQSVSGLKDIPAKTKSDLKVKSKDVPGLTVTGKKGKKGKKGKRGGKVGSGAGKGVGKGGINELFYDPAGKYYDEGTWVPGQIGGHSDHVHVSAGSPKRAVELGKMAQRMGLHVGEQDKFGGRPSGGHTAGSYHYSGRAIDVSGDSGKMAKFYRAVKRRAK